MEQTSPDVSEELRAFESQMIQYVDRATGEVLAECHRYIVARGPRSGELGGSGRPDPKWLLVDEEEWNISHRDDEPACEDWPSGAHVHSDRNDRLVRF